MNSKVKLGLIAAVLCFAAQAQSSTITIETGTSYATQQASAEDYKNVVNAAVTQSANVAIYDGISNQSVFGGSANYFAFKSTINFYVGSSVAGLWDLRSGVDFGMGGAAFLDGVAIGYKTDDMWWNGSYGDTSQSFQFSNVLLNQGNHTLSFYGLEHCCDGGQQAQFKAAGSNDFVTFSNYDNLVPVPEPETYALFALGLGAIAISKRRKNA